MTRWRGGICGRWARARRAGMPRPRDGGWSRYGRIWRLSRGRRAEARAEAAEARAEDESARADAEAEMRRQAEARADAVEARIAELERERREGGG